MAFDATNKYFQSQKLMKNLESVFQFCYDQNVTSISLLQVIILDSETCKLFIKVTCFLSNKKDSIIHLFPAQVNLFVLCTEVPPEEVKMYLKKVEVKYI